MSLQRHRRRAGLLLQHREQPLARGILGRDVEDAPAHRDRLLRAALIAIRERDRAVELDGLEAPAGLAHHPGGLDAKTEIVRLGLEPLLEVFQLHDGVNDTWALNVIVCEFCGSDHFCAIVFMQLSNVSPRF